ncbi:MAG: DNA polymerase IV [Propioniciclava sp.]
MRQQASILHLDLDAFFAAVEQRDKPSLRGKPVIVGGVGQRGVVSTASYEARRFGVRSAMPMHEARRLCPQAAFLAGRFDAYRVASSMVMAALRELSPLVEPLSFDEAFVDLAAGNHDTSSTTAVTQIAAGIREVVAERTGGLTASVGLGSSKFVAKLATEMAKPDGIAVIEPGTEADRIADLPARAIPGVGPATMERLDRLGARTIADIRALSRTELIRELGRASGDWIEALAWARDDRPVVAEREAKSISVEDTFETDLTDLAEIRAVIERDADVVAQRLGKARLFARTVSIKVRLPDFTTHTRSQTLRGATDRPEAIVRIARGLVDGMDTSAGVRLLGVGVSGFTEVAQEELFDLEVDGPTVTATHASAPEPAEPWRPREHRGYVPGADVAHAEFGPGWVWGSGRGRVTVRFETARSGPGPVKTFTVDDPALQLVAAS